MEFELSFTVVTIMLVVTVAIVLKTRKPDDLRRVPGPTKLPLIGNLHLLLKKSPPHRVFRELSAEYGAMMQLQFGQIPFLIVSSVEVAKQVMKTHDAAFANRPPVLVGTAVFYNNTSIAGAPYGEYWRRVRRICTLELLSARRVKTFKRVREEENRNLAKWIASKDGSPVGLSERLYTCSFDVISRASIGTKTDESPLVTAAIKQVLKMATAFTIADLYPSLRLLPMITGLRFKIRRIFGPIDRILQGIIDGHRADDMERSEDLVDVLLKYQKDGAEVHLIDDNIKAVIMDMFLAGGETSAIAVDWAMSEMIKDPSTLRRAQDEVRKVFDGEGYVDEEKFDELKYLKLVIKETDTSISPIDS